MASLKNLLRSTLSSWRGSHKSVPVSTWIAVDTTITTGASHVEENSYVAPADGFLVIQVEWPARSLVIRKNGMDWISGPNTEGPWFAWFVPSKAGDVWNFSVENTQPKCSVHLRFYPMVGESE